MMDAAASGCRALTGGTVQLHSGVCDMFTQLLTIARNTFTESIRQPIFAVLVLLGGVAMVLNVAWAANTLENDTKMMMDLSLSVMLLVGLLLAAFAATSVLTQEIENRTVLTVVSKPVSRPVFIVGKYLGVVGALALAFFVLGIVFLLTCRHGVLQTASDQLDGPVVVFGLGAALVALSVSAVGNYLYNWVFSSTLVATMAATGSLALLLVLLIDKQWAFQNPLSTVFAQDVPMSQLLIGLLLIFQTLLILTAVALAASTRLGQIMTLLVSFGVFIVGLASSAFSGLVSMRVNIPDGTSGLGSLWAIIGSDTAIHLKLIYVLSQVFYLVLPNLDFLWIADAINTGQIVTLSHVGWLTVYSLLYVVVVLAMAVVLFQRREVG